MQSSRNQTCQFCKYLWNNLCPFESAKLEKRKINDEICGSFSSVKSGKEFKDRLRMKTVSKKDTPQRSLEF